VTGISIPISDRRRTHAFYSDGLGLTAAGPIAQDGLPEPLRYDIDGTSVLLIPTGGFHWAIGDRTMANPEAVGCLLTLGVESDDEVVDLSDRAARAGGTTIVPPTRQSWGMFAATFADPDGNLWMVTSAPLPTG
jgi:predicted lactoylglutathione lyase